MTQHKPHRLQGRITEVSIEGFRSLKRIEKLQIPQLTVLIGANGVGKSSFIRLFEMMGWMLRARNLQEFVLRKGGGDDQFFMGSYHAADQGRIVYCHRQRLQRLPFRDGALVSRRYNDADA